MKKKFIVPVLALALGTSSLAGCKQGGGNKPQPQPSGPTYTGIRLDTTAMDLEVEYAATAVSLEGLVVYAQYSDSTEQAVSSGYTWSSLEISGTDRLQLRKEVTITYQSKSAKVNFTILPEPEKNWTETEIALMEAHLLGTVIPYIELDPYEVEWDESDKALYIEGGEATQASLLAYSDKYRTDFQIGRYETAEGSGIWYYTFSKEIERSGQAPAVVQGQFYATDSSYAPKESGVFFLAVEVDESYDKDWPTEKVAALATAVNPAATSVIPSFEADYYKVVPAKSGYYGEVIGYKVESDPSASYKASLSGWLIDESGTYPYALSPDGKFGIMYVYTAAAKRFEIVVTEARKAEWPSDDLEDLVGAFAGADEIPELTGDEVLANVKSFSVYPEYDLLLISVKSGSESAVASAYVSALSGASWHQHKFYGGNEYVSPSTTIDAYVTLPSSGGAVYVYFTPYQPNDYLVHNDIVEGSDRLPSAFSFGSYTDGFVYESQHKFYYQIPAVYVSVDTYDAEYGSQFYYYYLEEGQYKTIYLASAEAFATALAEKGAIYKATWDVAGRLEAMYSGLSAAGFFEFEEDGSGNIWFASPSQDFKISFATTYNTIQVSFADIASAVYVPVSAFPADAIADYLSKTPTAVPEIPNSSEGFDGYMAGRASASYDVYAKFDSEAHAEAALLAYVGLLEAASYTETPASSGIFVSSDEEITIKLSRFGLFFKAQVIDSAVFPLAKMADFLGERGNYTEENVPIIAKTSGVKFVGSGNDETGVYTVTATFSDADQAAAQASSYEDALEAKGFAEDEENEHSWSNLGLALRADVSVDGAAVKIEFSSIYIQAVTAKDLNDTFGTSFVNADIPGYIYKSYVNAGYVEMGENQGRFYYLSSYADAINDFGEIDDIIYSDSDNWAYVDSGNNGIYTTYNYVSVKYSWLLATVGIGYNSSSETYFIYIDFSVLSGMKELASFLEVPSYTTEMPRFLSSATGFQTTSNPSLAYAYFGSYTTNSTATGQQYASYYASQYASKLVDYGFVEVDTNVYFDGYVYVGVYINSQGSGDDEVWYVLLQLTLATPEQSVAFYASQFFGVEDYSSIIPPLPLGAAAITDMDIDEAFMSVEFTYADDDPGADDPKTAEQKAQFFLAAYAAQLQTSPYEFSYNSETGEFVSADGFYFLSASSEDGVVTLSVKSLFYKGQEALSNFMGVQYDRVLPSFEGLGMYFQSYDTTGEDPHCGLVFAFGSGEVASAVLNQYLTECHSMGLEVVEMSGYYIIAGTSGGYDVYVYAMVNSDNQFVVDVVNCAPVE